MKLIVNADDLGISSARDRGIFEAATKGVVSSATLLVNGPNAEQAARDAERNALSLGLHFNISEGAPISSPDNILGLLCDCSECSPSLKAEPYCNCDLVFRGKSGIVEALDRLGERLSDSIAAEFDAQLKRFVELTGKQPTHLDSHQHVHLHPVVINTIAKKLRDNQINFCRLPQKAHLDHSSAAAVLKDYGCKSSDFFIGCETIGAAGGLAKVVSLLDEFDDSANVEWMVHPGYPCNSWDEFNCSKEREMELELLKSSQLKDYLESRNIELCSYANL